MAWELAQKFSFLGTRIEVFRYVGDLPMSVPMGSASVGDYRPMLGLSCRRYLKIVAGKESKFLEGKTASVFVP